MWTARARPPSGRAIRRWRGAAPGAGQAASIWGINGINYRQTINDNMLVVIMIETPTGVANAYDIASVPGVDVVIIGNNDLSSFSGFPQSDDRYQMLMTKVHDDVLRAGKIFGQANAQLYAKGPRPEQGREVLPERSVERWLDAACSDREESQCERAAKGRRTIETSGYHRKTSGYHRRMELSTLRVFRMVAGERSFSRAAEKLARTQPAVSLALQRLETELGEKLLDRSARDVVLTDAGRTVLEYARRFQNLESELQNSIAELRDHSAGRLVIGANESTSLYLLRPIERYRAAYPRIKVQIRRSFSSRVPDEIVDGNLELGIISYEPRDERIASSVIYTDSLAFVVSPKHRLARHREVPLSELGEETFIAHNVLSPYREIVIRAFHERGIALNMDVEMPTVETIRWMVEQNVGVAFLPRMCVEQEIAEGRLVAIRVPEIEVERKIYLVQSSRRAVSYAAEAFLHLLVQG